MAWRLDADFRPKKSPFNLSQSVAGKILFSFTAEDPIFNPAGNGPGGGGAKKTGTGLASAGGNHRHRQRDCATVAVGDLDASESSVILAPP